MIILTIEVTNNKARCNSFCKVTIKWMVYVRDKILNINLMVI